MTGTERGAPSTTHGGRTADAVVPVPRAGGPPSSAPAAASGLAWLVRSVTHVPGILHVAEGRVRFVSTRGVIVDGTPRSLDVTPARTGRGGFRLTVGDERLRLHVVRFAGAVDVPGDLRDREVVGALLTAGEPTAGAVWRRLLAPVDGTPRVAPTEPGAGPAVEPDAGASRVVRGRGWRPARARRACATPAPWY